MNTFQGSINQLLGMGAVATGYLTKQAASAYSAKRGAEYTNAYNASVEAAAKSYTKSGNKSQSKAALEAQAKAQEAAPGAGPKLPFLKKEDAALRAKYEADMKGLEKRTSEGVAKLKATKAQSKQDMYKQFGDYQELAPQIMAKLPAEERWKIQAQAKIKQKKAFDNFLDKIRGGKE